MKRYKLLKDLPFAKAGEELYLKFSEDSEFFLVYKGIDKAYTAELNPEFIDNFDEWFEEEPKIYFTIDFFRKEIAKVSEKEIMGYAIDNVKSLGLLFETKEEAEKYLEYLKAKEVIKKDTKGFKPDWSDEEQPKHYGYCNAESKRLWRDVEYTEKRSTIYFRSIKDIEESLENHPKEWKTYLTYEQ